jgi:hypothetical protein
MSEPIIFWRDGYDRGRGGAFVRGQSLNKIVAEWIAAGIQVAGIVIDPEHASNVECIIVEDTTRE